MTETVRNKSSTTLWAAWSEAGEAATESARHLTVSEFAELDQFVLAIDFGGTKVALATCDGHGRPLHTDRFEFDPAAQAMTVVSETIRRSQELLARTVRERPGGCLSVGVSSPGIVLRDRILLAPNVAGWENLSLGSLIGGGLDLELVVVGTDVKAAAAAEARWGNLAGCDPGIYLNLGTGIAAAVVSGGSVLFGAHGAAGELGYNLVDPDDLATSAHTGQAPLEELVGGRAIGQRGAAYISGVTTAEQVFEAARTSPQARRFVDSVLNALAMHVVNLAIAIDPERIAVGGGLMKSADVIMPALIHRITASVPFPPSVVPSMFINDAALRGAAAMALRGVRE